MRKPQLAVLGLLGAVFVLSLSGCEDATPLFKDISANLDSYVDLSDIHVSVHTLPEVYVHHPFTVMASISSLHPLTSLSGSGYDLGRDPSPFQAERLDQTLRPRASTGSYALCLIVDLRFDDDAAFDLEKYSTPHNTEQIFTLVPDVTTAQIAQWTVTPRDTFGFETVAHKATVRVAFDAETTCRVGAPSLLDDAFYLVSGSPNALAPAKFTVVNDDLRQQRAITAHLQPMAVAAVAAVTTASVAWAAGVFAWVRRRRRARRKQGASENVTHRRTATRSWFSVVVRGVALLSIGMVLITLGPSTVVSYLGTDATLGSFFGGIVVACVGIVFLARGVRRSRLAYSA
jgi:hypothetical protein